MSLLLSRPRLLIAAAVLTCELLQPAFYLAARVPLAFALIALGTLHGALDDSLAAQAFGIQRRSSFVGYLLALVPTALLWWLAPEAVLVTFLVVSAHHFGESDLQRLSWTGPEREGAALARGVTFIALLLTHTAQTTPVLHALGVGSIAALSIHAKWVALGAASAHIALVAWSLPRATARPTLASFALVNLLLLVADPLMGFAIYFTAWHAVEHCHEMRRQWPDRSLSRWLRLGAFNLVVTAGAIVGVAWMSHAGGLADQASWALLALGTLTFPHVVVVHALRRSHAAPRDEAIERAVLPQLVT